MFWRKKIKDNLVANSLPVVNSIAFFVKNGDVEIQYTIGSNIKEFSQLFVTVGMGLLLEPLLSGFEATLTAGKFEPSEVMNIVNSVKE